MFDIVIESMRAAVVGMVLLSFLRVRQVKELSEVSGWQMLVTGFLLIFFGTLIDITDNFDGLSRFVVIGDTPIQALLEKVVGYLFGFLLVALGIWQWLPKVVEHGELSRKKLEVEKERLNVLKATMRTVNHIVNNFLQNLQLFTMEAEKKNALDSESLELVDSMIHETAQKLKKIGDLNSTPEMEMAGGTGIDFEPKTKE